MPTFQNLHKALRTFTFRNIFFYAESIAFRVISPFVTAIVPPSLLTLKIDLNVLISLRLIAGSFPYHRTLKKDGQAMDTEIIFAKQKTAKSLLVVLSKQVAASILLLIASFYPVATTQKIELTSNTTSGSYSINLYSITSATQPGNPGASTTYVSKSGQLLYPVMFPTVTLNSQLFTNPPCVAVFFRYYSTSKQAGVSRSILPQLFFAAHRLYPYCIQRDVTVITPPTNPTNDTAIIRYVISRQLPQPNPSLDPPFALVGLKAFLSSGASLSDHLDTETAIGEVTADATGVLNVDFGDGSPSLTTTSLGGPFPSGNITHTWTATGCYVVTVTENWTVSYHTPNGGGTITGLSTIGTDPRYCVYNTTSQIYR